MGAIAGIMRSRRHLRKNGHSPSEASNETVEGGDPEPHPLIGKNGMEWMWPKLQHHRPAGRWTGGTSSAGGGAGLRPPVRERAQPQRRACPEANSSAGYGERLGRELSEMADAEMGAGVAGAEPPAGEWRKAAAGPPGRARGEKAATPPKRPPLAKGRQFREAPEAGGPQGLPEAGREGAQVESRR
jgi:hypothetical protein